MKIYEYESYEEYVEAQTEANKRKIRNVWVRKDILKLLKLYKIKADVILCHGTRNAAEQKYLKEIYPNATEVVGTEISETASQFPFTIQHDFHEELPEFTGRCDIVYSNSFDHSYDPDKCLKTWSSQLNGSGYLFLELMIGYENRSKSSDPLSITRKETIDIASKHGLTFVQTEMGRPDQSELVVFRK